VRCDTPHAADPAFVECRLDLEVEYQDNDVELAGDELPVPDPLASLGGG
jgi:hypothetical protein